EVSGGLEDRIAGVDTDLCPATGLEKLGTGERTAAGLKAEAGEALEHYVGEPVEAADDEGEEADIKGLLHEALKHVLVGAPGPEQTGERDVYNNERGGQE